MMFARAIGMKIGGYLGRRVALGLGRSAVGASGRFAARSGRFAMTGRGQLAITGGALGAQALYGAGRRSGRGSQMMRYQGGGGGFGGGGGATAGGGGIDAPVVYEWDTGTAKFARLANGKIAVQRKDGTVKVYRPYRPVVIPKKWNASSMRRVATALKRQRKTADAIVRLTGGHVYANAMKSERAIKEAMHHGE